MDMHIYMLDMTVGGIKNLAKDIKIDFYKKQVNRNFNKDDYKVKAIYGDNGAGKTAVITAVSIAKNIVLNQHYLDQKSTQNLLHELINKQTKRFHFNVEYLIDDQDGKIIISYEVSLQENENGIFEIAGENGRYKNGNSSSNKYKTLFNVESGNIEKIDVKNPDVDEEIRNSTKNLLYSRSLINIVMESLRSYNKDSDLFYNFGSRIFMFAIAFLITNIFIDREDMHESYITNKTLNDTVKEAKNILQLNELTKKPNITEREPQGTYKVHSDEFNEFSDQVMKMTEFIKIFKPELKNIVIEKKEDGEYLICRLLMEYESYSIDSEFESTGIRRLMRLFSCLNLASFGFISFIDEMDANINSVFLDKLVEYFSKYGEGQLCFTIHNLEPMRTLKKKKCAISFLTPNHEIVNWVGNGNSSPDEFYRKGMIVDYPINIEAEDFIRIFGEDNE